MLTDTTFAETDFADADMLSPEDAEPNILQDTNHLQTF